MNAGLWSRGAATLIMCAFTGAAVILHQNGAEPATAADPHAAHIMPRAVPVAVTTPAPLPRTGWSVTADSSAGSTVAGNAIDNNPATTWRTAATALPHTLTIDTHNLVAVSGLTYLPPSDSRQRPDRAVPDHHQHQRHHVEHSRWPPARSPTTRCSRP